MANKKRSRLKRRDKRRRARERKEQHAENMRRQVSAYLHYVGEDG